MASAVMLTPPRLQHDANHGFRRLSTCTLGRYARGWMRLVLHTRAQRLALRAPFRISRGVKTHAEVVVAELACGEVVGRGECVPYPRYGETLGSVRAALAAAAGRLAAGDAARAVAA